MKEKDYEDNEINTNSNNLDYNKENNELLNIDINPKEMEKEEPKDIQNEEKEESPDLLLTKEEMQKIGIGSKILCPIKNCLENCIINIDPNFFEVSFKCMGEKHKKEEEKKMDIINFVKKSILSKDGKEECFYCKNDEKIEKDSNNKILYKCYCDKIICSNCKNKHLEEKKDNINEHNLIKFKNKDYICGCNKKEKKFSGFCIKCNKNLCIGCIGKHSEHEPKKFGDLFHLSKEQKKDISIKLEFQEKCINIFNEIIDNWLKRIKEIIDKYKIKLELYHKINCIIFNQYNPSKNNYESIKNAENMCFYFDENFTNLIDSKDDFIRQNTFIFNLINDNMDKNKHFVQILNDRQKKLNLKETIKKDGSVKHLCQLKKKEIFIAEIYNENTNKEELCFFKEYKKEKLEFLFSINEENKILNIKELKDGNLLIINKKQFKILDISNTRNSSLTIQESKNDYNFIDIIELINGYLVGISYFLNNNNNYIIFFKKNLINGFYEKEKKKEIHKPISIMEINKEKFVVLFKNNDLIIYDSKKAEETELITINSLFNLKKMIKIEKDGILFYNENYLALFSILSLKIIYFKRDFIIIDICNFYNSNKYFLGSFYEGNDHGFILLEINLLKYEIYTKIKFNNRHSMKINCIFQLSNGDIVSGSDDKTIKIWDSKQ